MSRVVQPGNETIVNTTTDNPQIRQSVASLAGGGWVVSWDSFDGSGTGIYQQRFTSAGKPIGLETRVNTTTKGPQLNAKVDGLADGGWIVTWESHDTKASSDIFQQRYDWEGKPVGGEVSVTRPTGYEQAVPHVAGLRDGGWIVTWHGEHDDGAGVYDVFSQRYDVDGSPVGKQVLVSTDMETGTQAMPIVTALLDGSWVVTWRDGQQDEPKGPYF